MSIQCLFFRCLALSVGGILLLLACSIASPLPPDETSLPDRILYICHLNFDCIEDTVIGVADEHRLYMPHAIAWGRQGELPANCPGHPGVTQEDILHRAVAVPRTRMIYPSWSNFRCNVAFQEVNGDSLPDIIFFMRGKVAEERDTARVLVLFGQKWLDTVAVVDITQVKAFQYEGFFAIDMRYGRDLVEPEVRDISGIESHVLLPVALNVLSDSSITPRSTHEAGPTLAVRIHPNPAIESAQIEGHAIPAGDYTVEIIAVNGKVRWQQDATVDASGNLLRMLDLRPLESGYYLVRLHQHGRPCASYPIIITR